MIMLNINNICKSKLDLPWRICVLFYSLFVCVSAYANVFFTTICECICQINIYMSGVHCGSAVRYWRRFRTTLLLRTTCMCLWCNWAAGCVVALQKPKTKTCCTRLTSWRASDSPDKAQHQLRPPKLRIPIPLLNLIQHHLTLLHASSRGNDHIGSVDLLDSGGWVAHRLQVHHQWCTGGQRGAHPWDHNDGPCGHFHKSCNQQLTIFSTQMSKTNMRLAPRLNWTNHLRAPHTTFDNQYGHKKTNTKYWNTT